MWLYITPLFLCNCVDIFVFSGGTCRPHPYRKRPTLGNVSNQHLQQSYSLGYQDSYSPEYTSVPQVTTRYSLFRYINIKGTCIVLCHILCTAVFHLCAQLLLCQAVMRFVLMPSAWSPQEPLAHLYEQQENIDTGALAGFSQQVHPNSLFQGYINKKPQKAPLCNYIRLRDSTVVICFACPSSSLISLTTVSRFPTTITLPAHPCLTSAQEPRPAPVASQIPSSTG